jgi:uncharacterized surface protein with fasciclin (FAS1) repeats
MSYKRILLPVLACAVVLAACTPVAQEQTTETQTPVATQQATATQMPVATPVAQGNTIVDLAVETEDLSTLVSAVTAADLVDTLSGAGPFTVFAPNNAAFAKVPKATLDGLLKPTAKADLTNVLTYHVVAGEYMAKDLKNGQKLMTVQGEELTVTVTGTKVMVGGATVLSADVEASNGVVHVIDTVLIPKNPASTAKASGSPVASPRATGTPAAR